MAHASIEILGENAASTASENDFFNRLLGPGEVPIHDAEVRLAFFKEVGGQADFQAVLEHDFTGANARASSLLKKSFSLAVLAAFSPRISMLACATFGPFSTGC